MKQCRVFKKVRFLLPLVLFVFLTSQSQLKIYCLDVNQGDATLLIAPSGETLLIDAGMKTEAKKILEILRKENIGAIDYAVLTHFDNDHRGGFALLKDKGIAIRHPIFDHGKKAPKSYTAVVTSRQTITPGDKFKLGSEVSIKCLAAARKTEKSIAPRNAAPNYGENQNSIALLVQYKGFDFFIGGDLTTNVEEALVDDSVITDVDVYHVSHHGSTTSSSEDLVQEIAPEVSIVSNGSKYNHPTQAVVDLLWEQGSVVYQTNKNTNSKKRSEPLINVSKAYIGDINPAKGMGSILIYVDSARSEYVISLERKGFKNGKTYSIEK
ncbi:MAG: MBL fold metallo-hydrolase [Ignavibacteria bacterium]|nr:MBL fold metallo-hydrolase [Ignavibacteria bacterium]